MCGMQDHKCAAVLSPFCGTWYLQVSNNPSSDPSCLQQLRLLPSNVCLWEGLTSWGTKFRMSRFFQKLWKYMPSARLSRLYSQWMSLSPWNEHSDIRISPQTDTHSPVQSDGYREMAELQWRLGISHLSGCRAENMGWGASCVLTDSLKEFVGTLAQLQICRWQCATLHKPAALHSFGEILTRLQWTFCFTSYSLHDLRGEIKQHRPGELRSLSLEYW